MIERLQAMTERQRLGLVFLFSMVFWVPALWGQFAWDDTNNLVDSDRLRGWGAIVESFKHDAMWSARMGQAAIGTYRPISLASFVVDYQIFGGSALGYHLMNLLWHAATCVVTYLVLRRLLSPLQALMATLLFCIHPVNNEAVAWINGRSEIFALLFGGLGVLIATSARGGPLRYLLAAVLLLLALLGKESGVMFCGVAVLMGTEVRYRRAGEQGWWLSKLDLGAIAAAVLALGSYLYIRTLVFSGGPLPGAGDKLDMFGQAASVIMRCLGAVVAPVDLSVSYLYLWWQSLTPTDMALAWTLLGILLGLCALAWYAGRRAMVIFFAWWLLAVAPVIILVGRDWPGLARWLYMGSPGIFAGAVLLFSEEKARRIALPVGAAFTLVFAIQCQRGIQVWKDSRSVFEKMIEEVPEERFGYLSLTWYYIRINYYEGAEKMARKVLELGPRGHDVKGFLAAAQAGQNRCDEARQTANGPDGPPTRGAWMLYAVASCFERAGRPADAKPLYDECAATDKACEHKSKTLASAPEATILRSAEPEGPDLLRELLEFTSKP